MPHIESQVYSTPNRREARRSESKCEPYITHHRWLRLMGLLILSYALCIWSVGCDRQSTSADSKTSVPRAHQVIASFYPLAYFARALLNDVEGVQVSVLTPEGEDPAQWTPGDREIATLQRASLILLNGAGFERWIRRVSFPLTRTRMTADAFRSKWLHYTRVVRHQHGPEGSHSHEGVDGHTWLDPLNAIAQMEACLDGLKHMKGLSTADLTLIDKNAETLRTDLSKLDARWRAVAPLLRRYPLIASHPAYQYLSARYALSITSLDLAPDAPLTDESQAEIDRAVTQHPAILLWESEPLPKTRSTLNAQEIISITLSPLESPPSSGETYVTAMLRQITQIEDALTTLDARP